VNDLQPAPEMIEQEGSPLLGPDAAALAAHEASEPEAEAGAGRWTPEAVKAILQGAFALVAVRRGPHWAWQDEEGDPLVAPATAVFNDTPFLRNISPEYTNALVVALGLIGMAERRIQIDRYVAAEARRAQREAETEAPETTARADTGGSPYGPDRTGGKP
jgi:hypothetical protein